MPDKRPTVAQAVISFMTVFSTSPAPDERLKAFLGNLSKDPRWTPEEIEEVRRLVEERLRSGS